MTTAHLEQVLLDEFRSIPPGRQQEVIDFAAFVRQRAAARGPRDGGRGLWSDHGAHITAEDIDMARQEMWGRFARETAA